MNYAPLTPVLAAIALSACFHSAVVRPSHRMNYWEALAELHPGEAAEAARTDSERAFAESLRDLMRGDIERAEKDSNSSAVRRVIPSFAEGRG